MIYFILMNTYQNEINFFHDISSKVLEYIKTNANDIKIHKQKGVGDYSTQIDIGVENLIVEEIKNRFPDDRVLAEEGSPDSEIADGRIWIIDPICGTGNLAKGINNYCTNIALADHGTLLASCVVDHNRKEYFWSVGNNEIYINKQLYQAKDSSLSIKIDIDFGSVRVADQQKRDRHNRCLRRLVEETDFDLLSLNTSLGFAYTAIGRVDGFINIHTNPWDVCAGVFLIQQAGGVVTDIDGNPWKILSPDAVAGITPEIHKKLLSLYNA